MLLIAVESRTPLDGQALPERSSGRASEAVKLLMRELRSGRIGNASAEKKHVSIVTGFHLLSTGIHRMGLVQTGDG